MMMEQNITSNENDEDDDQMFTIRVKTMDSNEFKIILRKDSSVNDLKNRIDEVRP